MVRFYNQRGTAEQWIKEGKPAVKMTRLSCHCFRSNEVRLVLPLRVANWSVTSLQQRLVKTGEAVAEFTGNRSLTVAARIAPLIHDGLQSRARQQAVFRRVLQLPRGAG